MSMSIEISISIAGTPISVETSVPLTPVASQAGGPLVEGPLALAVAARLVQEADQRQPPSNVDLRPAERVAQAVEVPLAPVAAERVAQAVAAPVTSVVAAREAAHLAAAHLAAAHLAAAHHVAAVHAVALLVAAVAVVMAVAAKNNKYVI